MSCTYRNSFFESDDFYAYSLHFLSIFQVPLHIFGVYVVVWKTPKDMENVKFSMLVLHLTFSWLDIYFTILSIPVVFIPAVAGYPLGLLYYLGVPIWFMTYMGYTSTFLITPAVLLFFEHRYNYLVRTDSTSLKRKIKRAVHYFINYMFTFLAFVPAILEEPGVSAWQIVQQRLPCLPQEIINSPRLYILGNNTFAILIGAIPFVIISWTQIGIFFTGTARYIYKVKTHSERTTQMQKQFFKALCIQLIVPIIVALFPCSYVIYSSITGDFDMALTNIAFIWLSTHGLFATAVMLIIHKPYREATMIFFRAKRVSAIA